MKEKFIEILDCVLIVFGSIVAILYCAGMIWFFSTEYNKKQERLDREWQKLIEQNNHKK